MELAAANICIGLIGFTWLLVRTSRRWSEYPDEVRRILATLVAVFFALLVTSIEMFRVEEELGYTGFVISAVKGYVLFVLWTTRGTKFRTGTRTHEGNPGADQNRDVA